MTFELDGHKYELVISDDTWRTAYDAAAERGGHLVTINSQAELDKCGQVAADSGILFLRLCATREDWEAGVWHNGESFDVAPWFDGEPSGGEEDCLAMFQVDGGWYFNDTANYVEEYAGRKGYIIEWDE